MRIQRALCLLTIRLGFACLIAGQAGTGLAQALELRLLAEDPATLAADAPAQGDPQRGAVVFYQPLLACTKCHVAGRQDNPLGPDLSQLGPDATDRYLVESVLEPSKTIKAGFEPWTVVTAEGKTFTGLLVEENGDRLVLRDPSQDGRLVLLGQDEIEARRASRQSIMPAGQVNQLASRQQFLDLIRYLIEIRDGGPARAKQLEPAPSLYAVGPLPEYENHIDHAGMIAALDEESFRRGEQIYHRLCVNCHGTPERPGTLPTSRRFASEPFKNGSDPYTMYQTLTRGFGMMAAQTWMVPQQKYDVIHYIREAYLKPYNPSQYVRVDRAYLERLPKGSTRGPEPSSIVPWQQMDYGPNLIATYEIPDDPLNFAYKGIAVRLDPGPGGVSHGRHWMIFDHDTMRVAAAWSGKGFIDWNNINFNGRHAVHPRLVGRVQLANPIGPGWANPEDGSFDDPRLRGRDGRPYGPLPRRWAHYRGIYHYGLNVIVSYTVGQTPVLEMPGVVASGTWPVFTRALHIGPRPKPMVLQVAHHPNERAALHQLAPHAVAAWRTLPALASAAGRTARAPAGAPALDGVPAPAGRDAPPGARLVDPGGGQPVGTVAVLGPEPSGVAKPAGEGRPVRFDGATYLEIARSDDFDWTGRDYSIYAVIKTRKGGTILCKTAPRSTWSRDGKSLFVRRGHLVFDIGWVGAVQSRRTIDEGRWHDVAMTWRHETGRVSLYIDGRLDRQGDLRPRKKTKRDVVRLGYTASDFPRPASFFEGRIAEVRFYRKALGRQDLAALTAAQQRDEQLVARWDLTNVQGDVVRDRTGRGHDGTMVGGVAAARRESFLVAWLTGHVPGAAWLATDRGQLRLKIPAGDRPLDFTVHVAQVEKPGDVDGLLASLPVEDRPPDLTAMTHGGPPRWPEILTTQAVVGDDAGPFAVDVLTHPAENPWFCRMRLTGFDFLPGGDRAAVCSWDGDVWLVRGLAKLPRAARAASGPSDSEPGGMARAAGPSLTWQRIASGLFQPLGLKVVDGRIYVSCRDQIVILNDLNGDGETDFYENFNNDHQVTEHFHEFAMGLQTDQEGNFYYAKSARHALPAVVPQHGTLLRVRKDGSRTDILAQGFRAANGVCVNRDGTFFVTDQEGHWTPKNRINWVTPRGGFFGNMWAYHDVTDPSDAAMEQPLCWITNAFDRSPAELLWVDSRAWGPLGGSLLNLSYGYGKIFVVPHEKVRGQMQGGMSPLPLPPFPTGIMRGRFHPQDGQLYVCGMFAWGGDQQQPGGFYRVRYTGRPVYLPIGLRARRRGMAISFTEALDRAAATDADNYAVKTWSLRRSANYGSPHYNEHNLEIAAAALSEDGKTVFLEIPDIQPTWCMEIKYSIKTQRGQPLGGVIHNTVHHLPEGP